MFGREKGVCALPDLFPKAACTKALDDHSSLISYSTLLAGCEFVSRYPIVEGIASGRTPSLAAKVQMRVTANRIRELDRFLAVLLNDTVGQISGAGHDAEQFDRISNTSKKLLAVEHLVGMASADHGRLRAMGRIAARLRGPSHHWRAPSLIADMGLARGGAGGGGDELGKIDLSHGKAIIPLSLNLATISSFYQDIGRRVIQETGNKNYSP